MVGIIIIIVIIIIIIIIILSLFGKFYIWQLYLILQNISVLWFEIYSGKHIQSLVV